ncbi:MAG TPA: TIGR03936 family radical SAM-associated protein, partial [Anaerovoracaceae bacterium]|nr:TIGR03936 family radical SAM-associated protein [Anaerovoracaceae bacterium]
MSRYVIKFSKEGAIRYISHLDLFRLFKRSFKRAGIRLQHSQGFNPHPRMSFAQPLSLGYSSSGEYLEFETQEPYPTGEILEKISSVMPEGIAVFSCEELPAAGKSLAALTEYADYEIRILLENGYDLYGKVKDTAEGFLTQEKIVIQKHQKKSGKEVEVDIKPMIKDFAGLVDNNNIMLTMKLAAGSAANLNPEAVLSAFCEFAGIPYSKPEAAIKRTELYFRESAAEKVEEGN